MTNTSNRTSLALALASVVLIAGCSYKASVEEYHSGYYQAGYWDDAFCEPAYYDAYGNFQPAACYGPTYVDARYYRPYISETPMRVTPNETVLYVAGPVVGGVVGGVTAASLTGGNPWATVAGSAAGIAAGALVADGIVEENRRESAEWDGS